MDPRQHKRFLDYREQYGAFGSKAQPAPLSAGAFAAADDEYRALDARGDARDDEEQARYVELARLLFRD